MVFVYENGSNELGGLYMKILFIPPLAALIAVLASCSGSSMLVGSSAYNDDLYYDNNDKPMKAAEPVSLSTTPSDVDVYNRVVAGYSNSASRQSDVDSRDFSNVQSYYNNKSAREAADSLAELASVEVKEVDGYWENGFWGSSSDQDYAERLVRFHGPFVGISYYSPIYSQAVYFGRGDWNVYVSGGDAYLVPTWGNPYYNDFYWGLGFNWRRSHMRWSFGYGFGYGYGMDPWYYSPYDYGYWGWGYPYYGYGYYDHYHYGHHHHGGPHYAHGNGNHNFGGRSHYYGSRTNSSSAVRGSGSGLVRNSSGITRNTYTTNSNSAQASRRYSSDVTRQSYTRASTRSYSQGSRNPAAGASSGTVQRNPVSTGSVSNTRTSNAVRSNSNTRSNYTPSVTRSRTSSFSRSGNSSTTRSSSSPTRSSSFRSSPSSVRSGSTSRSSSSYTPSRSSGGASRSSSSGVTRSSSGGGRR